MSGRPAPPLLPILVLCGAGADSGNWRLADGWGFPPRGRLALRALRDGTAGPRRFRGLAWGVGDPAAAFLASSSWAVVRVDDADGPVEATGGVLEFSGGWVIYRGDSRGALETLIQHGADRATLSVQLVLPDLGGLAEVGAFGVAVAGDSGMARGGAHSHALVADGYNGLAVAGRGGRAIVGGQNGIAIVGADGHATACGLAVARGPGAWLQAREPGVAVALAAARALEVDAGGIAIGLDRVQRITLARHAVAVVRDATGSRLRIAAGEGALIVVRWFDAAAERPRFSIAQAGRDGLAPDAAYVWADGTFHPRADYVAPADEGTAAAGEPAEMGQTDAPPPGPVIVSTDEIVIAPADGWAISEGGGLATAGDGGLARSSQMARARDGGVAITDGGTARAGARGIAVCDDKRYGTAETGDGGVAVGLGSRFATISAGEAGAAIYAGWFAIVTAGDAGIAIGGFESTVRVGANGIAIATCKCPSGGPGSLLVCRDHDGTARWAVVGEDGTIPPEFREWAAQLARRPDANS